MGGARGRSRSWLAGVCLLSGACALNPGPSGGPAAPSEGELARPDSAASDPAARTADSLAGPSHETLRDAAAAEGVDEERVVAADREARESLAAMEERTRREFLRLFGPDPLGLARQPVNARRYEIPLETNRYVASWIDYFRHEIPERFSEYLEREARYGPMIRTKLREAGLPEDLVYKALIESGMNPRAYSRARAVGMWQFMSWTGRKYGLEVSYWLDERRDPIRSTEAAIGYLSDLYDEFGSWYLAAAAYNAGEGRVRRSIARTGHDDYWSLVRARALPRETRNHVPKIIAAALIARNPAEYGFRDLDYQEPIEYDEVTVPDATSLDVIAEAAGTTEDRIRELNPQFPRRVTPPGRSVTVRVPRGHAGRFAANYERIPPSERVTWLVHRVTRGQTLSHIAERYGTSVRAILASNEGLHPRRLQIGQRVVVPRMGRGGGGAPGRASRVAAAATGGERPTTVVVRRGDTLWTIARRYDVTTRELKEWNGLGGDVIRPGDRLEVRR